MDIFEQLDARRNWIERWLNKKIPSGIAGMNPYYILTHPKAWKKIPKHYYNAMRCRYMRGKNGWDYTDTWSLDYYILSWLPEAIAYLRDNSHGYPADMGTGNSLVMALDFDESSDGMVAWKSVLTAIEQGLIDGRTYIDILSLKDMTMDEREELRKNFEAAWALMGEYFFALWD